MKNSKKTMSIAQCLVLVCVMSGVIHAQISHIPNNNYNFREYVDKVLTRPVSMPQRSVAPQTQSQGFNDPNTYQMFSDQGFNNSNDYQMFSDQGFNNPNDYQMFSENVPPATTLIVPQYQMQSQIYNNIPNEKRQFRDYINTVVAPPIQIPQQYSVPVYPSTSNFIQNVENQLYKIQQGQAVYNPALTRIIESQTKSQIYENQRLERDNYRRSTGETYDSSRRPDGNAGKRWDETNQYLNRTDNLLKSLH